MSLRPTSTERQRFYDEYRRLWSTLANFYDPDGKTDAEIAQEYVRGCDSSVLMDIVADGQRFLTQRELPMKLIAHHANRYLITEAEQRQWLQTVLAEVEAALAARTAADQ